MKRNHDDICTSLDDLIDDLKVEILCKLPVKLLAKFTCVSKAWQRLIINFCFPKMAPNKLTYSGYVTRIKTLFFSCGFSFGSSFDDLWEKLELSRNYRRELLDSCNGLLLLCHPGTVRTQQTIPNLYHYYVINVLTKQCAIITKPYPSTGRNKFAALDYDPSKSCHYKIVRFVGFRSLNIFYSKNGNWITLRYRLENHVARANWEKRSIYFKGAFYRLSMSGHLIIFYVHQEINVSARVQAIELPKVARTSTFGCVGINKDQIHFSHSNESSLRIWVLQHDCSRTNKNYEWLLKCTILSNMIPSQYFQPMAFHPYDDTIILLLNKEVYIFHAYHFGDPPVNESKLSSTTSINYKWFYRVVFPFLQCEVPFAIGMVDEPTVSILPYFHLSYLLYCHQLYIYLENFLLMNIYIYKYL